MKLVRVRLALLALCALHGAQAATWYVATNGSDAADGTTWLTAKQTIQAAIDLSVSNDVVLVSNGVYATGGRVAFGVLTNRIVITNTITVRSVNGPAVTAIIGAPDPVATCGVASVRCALVTANATLSGFTLTGGTTRASGDINQDCSGGGVWCDTGSLVSNCVISGNRALYGAGDFRGTVKNCTFTGNEATFGGGSWYAELSDCTLCGNRADYGGGALEARLNRCLISSNTAANNGGGTWSCTVSESRLVGNWAASRGGGAYDGTLSNCLVIGNTSIGPGGGVAVARLFSCTVTGNRSQGYGGGVYYSTLRNCIVYYNEAFVGPNYDTAGGGLTTYCCTTPDPGGEGNITNEPWLASLSNPRLLSGSPCINAGTNSYAAGTDLDGEPRIVNGRVDIGCDEYTPPAGGLAVQINARWSTVVLDSTVPFEAIVQGSPDSLLWTWGDGSVATNVFLASHAFATAGVFEVVLRATNGTTEAAATTMVHVVTSMTVHVAPGGGGTPPYATWVDAATNLQSGIDAAPPGALVLVSNGIYASGGRTRNGDVTNRIVIENPVTVRSVNGPAVTVIRGAGPIGGAAVRCVYLGSNALLSGFTLTGGATRAAVDHFLEQGSGGGALCETNASISNCVLTGNAAYYGGGVFGGRLQGCRLEANTATYGGGASEGVLHSCLLAGNTAAYGGGSHAGLRVNCTLADNRATVRGGGAYNGTLRNCIVYYNDAPENVNHDAASLAYCCTTPWPGGTGNIATEPLVSARYNPHLLAASPCVDAGDNSGVAPADMDGEARIANGQVDIGCDEFTPPLVGPLAVQIQAGQTNLVPGFAVSFEALVEGAPEGLRWAWGDGLVTTNQFRAAHTFSETGTYVVVLQAINAAGNASATVTVEVADRVYHVAPGGGHVPPFADWASAATNIQAALDEAVPGALVLVSNGIYATGGRVVYGATTNRIAITNTVTVRSVNGPADTVIVGAGPRGDAAVRCAYIGSNAVLSGFTLTDGATRAAGDPYLDQAGGGAWCETNAVVSNCVLAGNSAYYGGGAYGGLLRRCRLQGNSAAYGGGVYEVALQNCLLADNTAVGGGGSGAGTLIGCTLAGNTATNDGGGVRNSTLYNCIVYHNTAPTGANYSGSALAYCCATPLASGAGNLTNTPLLAGKANPHLLLGSPCIDAGTNAYAAGTDFDGQPRLAGVRVDVGCDEFTAPVTGPLVVQLRADQTNLVVGYPVSFEALVEGAPESLRWIWGDGAATTNEFRAAHAFAATGRYAVVLQALNAAGSVSATVAVEVAERIYYVAPGGGHVAPFTDWTKAATTIQAALDEALPGALVLVSNGVYATGGRVVYGTMTNRIAITNALTVRSVNGPAVTAIVGAWHPGAANGDAAVRCVYLGTNCTLAGFTLTNGAVRGSGDTLRERSGGGLWAETNAVVSNCVLAGNAASYGGGSHGGVLQGCQLIGNLATQYGGGSQTSALHNCLLTGNRAVLGGGTHGAALYGCTVIGNTASSLGGGALRGNLFNTIVFHNQAPNAPNVFSASTTVCCTTPDAGGTGNVTNQPLVASAANPHLLDGSPCLNVGSNLYASGWDLDGEPRMDGEVVDIGCDEFTPPVSGPLAARIRSFPTNVVAGLFIFVEAEVEGAPTRLTWEWGDGFATTNLFRTAHSFATAGSYPVVLQVTNATCNASATVTVQVAAQPIHYVAPGGGHVPPFANWSDAATNIQAALDAASAGALVLVSNGIYANGGRVVSGAMTNRIAITNSMVVRSVNGPAVTLIEGRWDPAATNGNQAVRCAYVGTNSVLSGFTLTGGATRAAGDVQREQSGGAVYGEAGAVISNCLLLGNGAYSGGGGAQGGLLRNCVLGGNRALARGGGSSSSMLFHCTLSSNTATLGGGAWGGDLFNCTLVGNVAQHGGGSCTGALNNCILYGNEARGSGGGASGGRLSGCTLVGNLAAFGGGAASGTLNNCIVYYNQAPDGPNHAATALDHCCTTPAPTSGVGHVTNGPLLASSALPHLLAGSPCIDAGANAFAAGMDLDGEARIANGTVDIGCDEYTGPLAGPLAVQIRAIWTNFAPGFSAPFEAMVEGAPQGLGWIWGDGAATTNLFLATHAYAATGVYQVVLWATNAGGYAAATVTVAAVTNVYYVAPGGGHVPPFLDWMTAATNIQAAIDVAAPGCQVLVSNGVYATGGRVVFGAMTNRVAVTNALSVRSVNGPGVTVIRGNGPIGDAAVRCVYLAADTRLEGFTLTAGATRGLGDDAQELSGGGAWCATGALIRNCAMVSNAASSRGGGVYGGRVESSQLSWNSAAYGGGAFNSKVVDSTLTANSGGGRGGAANACVLENCELALNSGGWGGGSYDCLLSNCVLRANRTAAGGRGGGAAVGTLRYCVMLCNTGGDQSSATSRGGGIYMAAAEHCRLEGNLSASGGGAYMSVLSNCVLVGNMASAGGGSYDSTCLNCTVVSNVSRNTGGGVYSGSVRNSLIAGNHASLDGGGAYNSHLYGCTMVGNVSDFRGGGVGVCSLQNSIVYYNMAPAFPDHYQSAFDHSCTTPLPQSGTNVITVAPRLASRTNPHLLADSPCIDAGLNASALGVDLDGEDRIANYFVDMGCDEYVLPVTGPLAVQVIDALTVVAAGYAAPFEADVQGRPTTLTWTWGDGTATTNTFLSRHAFATAGVYAVVVRVTNETDSAAATVTVQVVDTVYHVAPGGGHIAPFANWADAATNIQAALDASVPGSLVLVSNGVYGSGGAVAAPGLLTNRASITKPVTVASVNGPAVTLIVGAPDPATTNGDAAVRCVYLCSNAVLSGFTLTNGATRTYGDAHDQRGGGVWCATNAVVSNCVLAGNFAGEGGGASFGTLNNCDLRGNRAGSGGGAYASTLYDCTLRDNIVASYGGGLAFGLLNRGLVSGNVAGNGGGGMYYSTVSNAVLRGNSSVTHGGGTYWGQLYNCLVSSNGAAQAGGGTFYSTAINCTLIGNVAAGDGGGAYCGALTNCIIYFNAGTCGSNVCGSTLAYSCTTLDPGGIGNITNNPLFAASNDFRLSAGSPCLDAGNSAAAPGAVDLDGLPRVRFGGVDMGAFEFQTPLGYWLWAEAITNGQTGYGESAAGDDHPNLLRYATGAGATGAVAEADLAAVFTTNQGVAVQFRRNTNAVDVTFLVEAAPSILDAPVWAALATNRLGSWGGATNVAEQPTNTGANTVQVWNPDGSATSGVMRLRVTRP